MAGRPGDRHSRRGRALDRLGAQERLRPDRPSPHHPARARRRDGRAKMLRGQGVLLAICSKNSPEVVDQVLAEHPATLLRAGDFVAQAVNWSPKDQNLRELAQLLNLGLDSMVFSDDSAFESRRSVTSRGSPAVAGISPRKAGWMRQCSATGRLLDCGGELSRTASTPTPCEWRLPACTSCGTRCLRTASTLSSRWGATASSSGTGLAGRGAPAARVHPGQAHARALPGRPDLRRPPVLPCGTGHSP